MGIDARKFVFWVSYQDVPIQPDQLQGLPRVLHLHPVGSLDKILTIKRITKGTGWTAWNVQDGLCLCC